MCDNRPNSDAARYPSGGLPRSLATTDDEQFLNLPVWFLEGEPGGPLSAESAIWLVFLRAILSLPRIATRF
jgi:hypothetical protein